MRHVVLLSALLALTPLAAAPAGIDRAGIDAKVAPGDDFWSYANGNWVAAHPIPADRSSFGTAAILVEEANQRTAALIEAAAKTAAPNSEPRKVGDFYASFLDEAAIEAAGLVPLQPQLARIAAIADRRQLARYLGSTLRADVDALNNTDFKTENVLGLWASPAFADPTRYAPFLLQGGLGMPDREYYLAKSPAMAANRAAYLTHVAAVLRLAGIADADAKAARIMAFETEVATVHASRADSADVQKANNVWSRASFATRAPGLDWNGYFAAAGLTTQPRFIVWHPGAVSGIAALAAGAPLGTWREYLTLRAIEHASPMLPKAFVDERFAFYSKTLNGTPQQQLRWKRGVALTNTAMGDAVGKLYVAKYFPPETKRQVQAMVANIVVAFGKRIDALDWMAPSTKVEARAKLAALKVGVGYPDRWRDYAGLQIVRGDPLGNLERAEAFEYRFRVARLGQPVDRGEWVMTPQTVNAVNLPMHNALNFPAAILQAPDFDANAAPAINYGGIGATIGHEISHSFDDQGAQFDSTGHLRNWWSKDDFAHFNATGTALAKQFDGYCPFADACVNGTQTLSENIADVAGLAAAHDAYFASLRGKPAPVVDGLNGDQQFFLAFAQSWRTYSRDAALRQALVTDGHAPARYRANTVRNLDAWYPAFGIRPAAKLALEPGARVKIW